MRRPWLIWILFALCLIVANLAGMAVPWLVGRIVDLLNEADATSRILDDRTLLRQAGALIGLSLIAGIGRFCMRWLMIGASRRVEYDLRNDLFEHLLSLDLDYFQRTPVGDLMARATNDLNAVRMLLGPGLMYPLNIAATLSVALTLMFAIDGRLTLIGLIPLPILSLLVYLLSGRLHRGFTDIQERFSLITTRVQETLSGIRVVKAFGREEAELDRFREAGQDYFRQNLRIVRMMALFMPSFRLFSGAAVILILFFGSHAVISGRITLGQLLAFIQYMIMLSWPMTALGWVTGVLQRGLASWRRILQVMDTEPAIASPSGPASEGPHGGDLEIRGLSFSYGGEPVLRDVDLTLPAGGSLGIVGATGSGKTTLLRLIPRLLDPPPGSIFLGGRDISTLPLARLRERIAWVGQEPLLFSETLEHNVGFARPDAPTSELDRVAEEAAVLSEIRGFPAAWETQIGERGINLSGGQKQRICLARALLKDAGILLLDAPFSSVDTQTEELILRALRGQLGARTMILVSHRVSTVSLAERIAVLDEGRIVELGTHEELLRLGGAYSRLHERQVLEDGFAEGGRSA